ncbi:MAG: hypothetical protein V3R94_06210 [Acidobacteriota bacterium]
MVAGSGVRLACGGGLSRIGCSRDRLQKICIASRIALLVTPFSYYLSAAESGVALLGMAIPFTLLAGAYSVKRQRAAAAWCLLVPLVATALWLAVIVGR